MELSDLPPRYQDQARRAGEADTKRGRTARDDLLPGTSRLEAEFEAQLRHAGLPVACREHLFARPRLWRFDFAWPERRIAIEVEGGIWSEGRHTRPQGFLEDVVKYNEAGERGWRVFRATADSIEDGSALALAERILT
jgi:very-short-patch-repair endonuclease